MKLLLLVQTESDVSHLDAAAKAVIASAISGVWLVFSPAVLVNATDAASALDAEIAQLQSAERAAADRGDYTAAAGYKVAREGKVLDRAKEIRDAHKKLTAEQRATRTKELFGPFHAQLQSAGRNAKISSHSDHYDRDQWVTMLNSLTGVWFKEFSPGSFMVAWPESVWSSMKETANKFYPSEAGNVAQQVTPPQRQPKVDAAPATRREELETLHPMKLGPIMRGLGLEHEGMSRAEKISAILDAEAAPAKPADAELATY